MAAIALGSNLESSLPSVGGDREANLWEAVERTRVLGEVLAVSTFYHTAPVGSLDQPEFLNGAMLLATELEPLPLLRGLLGIELAMGRDRSAVADKGPRVIDLDLLLFGDVVVETAELTLPHPAMRERRFVLEPLAEIAGEMVDPISEKTVSQLLASLVGSQK